MGYSFNNFVVLVHFLELDASILLILFLIGGQLYIFSRVCTYFLYFINLRSQWWFVKITKLFIKIQTIFLFIYFLPIFLFHLFLYIFIVTTHFYPMLITIQTVHQIFIYSLSFSYVFYLLYILKLIFKYFYYKINNIQKSLVCAEFDAIIKVIFKFILFFEGSSQIMRLNYSIPLKSPVLLSENSKKFKNYTILKQLFIYLFSFLYQLALLLLFIIITLNILSILYFYVSIFILDIKYLKQILYPTIVFFLIYIYYFFFYNPVNLTIKILYMYYKIFQNPSIYNKYVLDISLLMKPYLNFINFILFKSGLRKLKNRDSKLGKTLLFLYSTKFSEIQSLYKKIFINHFNYLKLNKFFETSFDTLDYLSKIKNPKIANILEPFKSFITQNFFYSFILFYKFLIVIIPSFKTNKPNIPIFLGFITESKTRDCNNIFTLLYAYSQLLISYFNYLKRLPLEQQRIYRIGVGSLDYSSYINFMTYLFFHKNRIIFYKIYDFYINYILQPIILFLLLLIWFKILPFWVDFSTFNQFFLSIFHDTKFIKSIYFYLVTINLNKLFYLIFKFLFYNVLLNLLLRLETLFSLYLPFFYLEIYNLYYWNYSPYCESKKSKKKSMRLIFVWYLYRIFNFFRKYPTKNF